MMYQEHLANLNNEVEEKLDLYQKALMGILQIICKISLPRQVMGAYPY